jgi:hypothetical protein
MILIPAGEFLMGSDPSQNKYARHEEQPQHYLYLPDFFLAKTPVTNVQYSASMHATGNRQPEGWTGRKPPKGREDHPLVYVSWMTLWNTAVGCLKSPGKPMVCPARPSGKKAHGATMATSTPGAIGGTPCAATQRTVQVGPHQYMLTLKAPAPMVCWIWRAMCLSGRVVFGLSSILTIRMMGERIWRCLDARLASCAVRWARVASMRPGICAAPLAARVNLRTGFGVSGFGW